MLHPDLPVLLSWLKSHPQVFAVRQEPGELTAAEIYSGKQRTFRPRDVDRIEQRTNRIDPAQTYVIVALNSGAQLVFSKQGFAFAPSFVNTGPLPLPAEVFCMRDYDHVLGQLMHLGPDRKAQAIELIMVLIALLDGAAAVGLDVDREARRVNGILERVERGEAPDPLHR